MEASIVKQSMNDNKPLPEHILKKPQLFPGLDLFLDAFYDLNADRQMGMSVGKIPFTAIRAYADEYQFEGLQREDLFYFVKAIDDAVVKSISKKDKGANGKKPTRLGKPAGKVRR